jgi:hypothetical protein
MTYVKSLAVFGVLFATLAQAALPPYYDRTRTIKAIVDDSRVETAITDVRFRRYSTGQIDSVRYLGYTNSYSRYQVQTGRCVLDVNVRVVSETGPDGHLIAGPGKLELAVARSLRCQ